MTRLTTILVSLGLALFFLSLILFEGGSNQDESEFTADLKLLERRIDALERTQKRELDELEKRLDNFEKRLFKHGVTWYPLAKPPVEQRLIDLERELEKLSQPRN